MATRAVNLRVPEEVLARIDEAAWRARMTRTGWILWRSDPAVADVVPRDGRGVKPEVARVPEPPVPEVLRSPDVAGLSGERPVPPSKVHFEPDVQRAVGQAVRQAQADLDEPAAVTFARQAGKRAKLEAVAKAAEASGAVVFRAADMLQLGPSESAPGSRLKNPGKGKR